VNAIQSGSLFVDIGQSILKAYNYRLQRTVTSRRERAASASLHCADAACWTARRAAAEPERYTPAIERIV